MIIIPKALTKAGGENCKNVLHLHKTHANYHFNRLESLSFILNIFLHKLIPACNLKMWYNKIGTELNSWQWLLMKNWKVSVVSSWEIPPVSVQCVYPKALTYIFVSIHCLFSFWGKVVNWCSFSQIINAYLLTLR